MIANIDLISIGYHLRLFKTQPNKNPLRYSFKRSGLVEKE